MDLDSIGKSLDYFLSESIYPTYLLHVVHLIYHHHHHYYCWCFAPEGLNEVRPAVYRAALKLLSLQKMCYSKNILLYNGLLKVHTGS